MKHGRDLNWVQPGRGIHASTHTIYACPQVLPQLLDALWAINRVEIEGTVVAACKRVLRDASQAPATREARARGE